MLSEMSPQYVAFHQAFLCLSSLIAGELLGQPIFHRLGSIYTTHSAISAWLSCTSSEHRAYGSKRDVVMKHHRSFVHLNAKLLL